jgi:hypothetical protein
VSPPGRTAHEFGLSSTSGSFQENADLSHAQLGDRGAEAFSHGLAVNRVIRKLSIMDNKLTFTGLMHVLRGLLGRVNVAAAAVLLQRALAVNEDCDLPTLRAPVRTNHSAFFSA